MSATRSLRPMLLSLILLLPMAAMAADDCRHLTATGNPEYPPYLWRDPDNPALLIGANVQDRRNPKDKYSQRFDEPGGTLDNTEVQTDVRDGTDYSANASYLVDVGGGELDVVLRGASGQVQFSVSGQAANGSQVETLADGTARATFWPWHQLTNRSH